MTPKEEKPIGGTTDKDPNRNLGRAKKRMMVRFGVAKPEKTGFTKDISETGLFIKTNTILKPGTTVQVQIHGQPRVFTMWAKVIWGKKVPPQLAHVLECGMGIRFLEPSPEWLDFCRERRSDA